jgi:hypothetical protein
MGCKVASIALATHHDQMIIANPDNGVMPRVYVAHRPLTRAVEPSLVRA